MPETESDEPVVVGVGPAPVDFIEPFVDQPVSPRPLTLRMPLFGAVIAVETPPVEPPATPPEPPHTPPDPPETPPVDPSETPVEGGNDA